MRLRLKIGIAVLCVAALAVAVTVHLGQWRWHDLTDAPVVNKVYNIRFHSEPRDNGTVLVIWNSPAWIGGGTKGLLEAPVVYGLNEVPSELLQPPAEIRLNRVSSEVLHYYTDAEASDPIVYLHADGERLYGYLAFVRWRPGPLGSPAFPYYEMSWKKYTLWERILSDRFELRYQDLARPIRLEQLEVVSGDRSIIIPAHYSYYLLTDGGELGHYCDKGIHETMEPSMTGFFLFQNASNQSEPNGIPKE